MNLERLKRPPKSLLTYEALKDISKGMIHVPTCGVKRYSAPAPAVTATSPATQNIPYTSRSSEARSRP